MSTNRAGMFTKNQILLTIAASLMAPAFVASFGIHQNSGMRMRSPFKQAKSLLSNSCIDIGTSSSTSTYISMFHDRHNKIPRPTFLSSTVTGEETNSNEQSPPEPSTMRIREIKDELNAMGVTFADCFDKDSLTERLVDARSGKVKGKKEEPAAESTTDTGCSCCSQEAKKEEKPSESKFDVEAARGELRSKKVRELRTMCAQNNIRWANMIEKEELVQALLQHQEKAAAFSPSGKILPGKVAVIDDQILTKEIAPGAAVTPLLLGE
jgi:hypothetical protein